VFVMGDNRDYSSDSRVWGFVPVSLLRGRAMVVWWSSGSPAGVRLGRFFSLVR
jgi:signal peptidase I